MHIPIASLRFLCLILVLGSVPCHGRLLAPPGDWIQEFQHTAALGGHTIRHAQAGEAYLRFLRGLLTGAALECEALAPAANFAKCLDPFRRGRAWPKLGITMAGMARAASISEQLKLIKDSNVPGAYLEAGVWRGGMSIYARASMYVYKLAKRKMYVADSFMGLPPPRNSSLRPDETAYSQKASSNRTLAVGMQHVKNNFRMYGVDSEQVVLVPGYFVDSLPPLREEMVRTGEQIALLRMDGDMYDSTIDILYNLYDLVPVGGIIVVDDWDWKSGCKEGSTARARPLFGAKEAVIDFHAMHEITAVMHDIDGTGAWWQKEKEVQLRRDLYLKTGQRSLKPKIFSGDDYCRMNALWEATQTPAERAKITRLELCQKTDRERK